LLISSFGKKNLLQSSSECLSAVNIVAAENTIIVAAF